MSVEQRMQRLAIQPSELLPLALYTYMYMYMHEPTVALNSARWDFRFICHCGRAIVKTTKVVGDCIQQAVKCWNRLLLFVYLNSETLTFPICHDELTVPNLIK